MTDSLDGLLKLFDKGGGSRRDLRLAIMKQFNCYECPTCEEVLDPEKTVWPFQSKVYCSQEHLPEEGRKKLGLQ